VQDGVAVRPEGTDAPQAAVPANSIQLFEHQAFQGDLVQIDAVTGQTSDVVHRVDRADEMSSLRWNLPPGVLVMLYQDAGGRGEQIPIWGRGEVYNVNQWKFNDKVSRWAWFNVGKMESPRAQLSVRPPEAEPTIDLPLGTVEVFEDANLKGSSERIVSVMEHRQGERHAAIPEDRISALRWNLPPGVVVILYEDAGGLGRQLPIWGNGEYENLNIYNFNDVASRWAWFDLGPRPTQVR